jgi:hypothetical protein
LTEAAIDGQCDTGYPGVIGGHSRKMVGVARIELAIPAMSTLAAQGKLLVLLASTVAHEPI